MIMRPHVNNNGDDRQALVDQRKAAMGACDSLLAALDAMAPHGRNYITAPADTYAADRDIHVTRLRQVDDLRQALLREALALRD